MVQIAAVVVGPDGVVVVGVPAAVAVEGVLSSDPEVRP